MEGNCVLLFFVNVVFCGLKICEDSEWLPVPTITGTSARQTVCGITAGEGCVKLDRVEVEDVGFCREQANPEDKKKAAGRLTQYLT